MILRITCIGAMVAVLACAAALSAAAPGKCARIQDGTIMGPNGETIQTGYDEWGYNYQAHIFNGSYCDSYFGAGWCQEFADDELIMKWNDAWLANTDCNGDHRLDSHWGHASYIGSGAWMTIHHTGSYELNGELCAFERFTKIVALPTGATCDASGTCHDAKGKELGQAIWGAFAVIQVVFDDPCGGLADEGYQGDASSGLGSFGG